MLKKNNGSSISVKEKHLLGKLENLTNRSSLFMQILAVTWLIFVGQICRSIIGYVLGNFALLDSGTAVFVQTIFPIFVDFFAWTGSVSLMVLRYSFFIVIAVSFLIFSKTARKEYWNLYLFRKK